MKKLFVYAALLLFICTANTAMAATVSSTFDSGLGGWTSNDGPTTLSNPGGYLAVTDRTASYLTLTAPNVFRGNWSGFNKVSADVVTFLNTKLDFGFQYQIYGNNNSKAIYTFPVNAVVYNQWNNLSADITQSNWVVTGDWNNLIGNVTDFKIRIDLNSGNDHQGLDNVTLHSAPVPEPATAFLGFMGVAGLLRFRRKK